MLTNWWGIEAGVKDWKARKEFQATKDYQNVTGKNPEGRKFQRFLKRLLRKSPFLALNYSLSAYPTSGSDISMAAKGIAGNKTKFNGVPFSSQKSLFQFIGFTLF